MPTLFARSHAAVEQQCTDHDAQPQHNAKQE